MHPVLPSSHHQHLPNLHKNSFLKSCLKLDHWQKKSVVPIAVWTEYKILEKVNKIFLPAPNNQSVSNLLEQTL